MRSLLVDTVSRSHDPLAVDESSSTADLLVEVLALDDGCLPWDFPELHVLSSHDLGLACVHLSTLCVRLIVKEG